MLSNVNIVIISRSPPGMKSVMRRPLGQTQQRTVAFQLRQIYPSLFAGWLCASLFEFQWKDDRLVNPLAAFHLLRQNMLFLLALESIKPGAVWSLMRASCRQDNAMEQQQLAARHCALCDRYRFSRRSHFPVKWLFFFFGSSDSSYLPHRVAV